MAESPTKHPCRCCGQLTLGLEPPGTKIQCRSCYWIDIDVPDEDPRFLAACDSYRKSEHEFGPNQEDETRESAVAKSLKEEALEALSKAFEGVRLEDGVSIQQATVLDDYGTREEERAARLQDDEKRWEDVPASKLERTYAFSFFDAKGFRFYLPAYLRWYVSAKWPLDSNSADSLTQSLSMSDSYLGEHFSLLTTEQNRAVALCVQYLMHHGFPYDRHWCFMAMMQHWHQYLPQAPSTPSAS